MMEKRNVPAGAILTEPFVPSGKAMALSQGFRDYPFVVIEHPVASTNRNVLRQRIENVMDDLLSRLVMQKN